jgi:hypothetical protein
MYDDHHSAHLTDCSGVEVAFMASNAMILKVACDVPIHHDKHLDSDQSRTYWSLPDLRRGCPEAEPRFAAVSTVAACTAYVISSQKPVTAVPLSYAVADFSNQDRHER